MFIYNVKINKSNLFKLFLGILAIICISLFIVGIYKMINQMDTEVEQNLIEDDIPSSEVAMITPENYTNILKSVHDDLDTYIGQKISFSGYVYKVSDLKENEFVLARDMTINGAQTVIVGFLCSLDYAKEFENYTWINITGTIEKGDYNGEIPCIKITEIERIEKPENDLVNLPDDTYVPTAVIY